MTSSGAPIHVRHLLVEGRVQGVGFRWFVRERARRLALKGWVRNRPDGSVEVMVAGPVAALGQFARDLEGGPQGAAVERILDVPGDELFHDARGGERDDVVMQPGELPFPFVIQR